MSNPFKIYNASAGSGKTYVLAKEYLKVLLATDKGGTFRQILAITFTNKAVNEMKKRILESLFAFGKVDNLNDAPPLFLDVMNELKVDPLTLKRRSKIMLKEILHNYSFFDISTIDKFTHRLIRTFAKDLRLSQSFEVVLDTNLLLGEAVDSLLDKAGTNPLLTKVLIDFTLEKIDGDKSWDISFDLNKIGKLLFDENQGKHLEKLEGKSIQDFLNLKTTLRQKSAILENQMVSEAFQAMELISQNGLVFEDFNRASFPKFIQKIHEGDLNVDFFDAEWKTDFKNKPLYTKNCPNATKAILDGLHWAFATIFQTIQHHFYQVKFLKNCHQNVIPLSVLHAIQQEIKHLQKERDLLPISSFNAIISKEIKDQPVPFIFERLGEKYRHYFIDEFQDTSEMQWNNLIPLIGNALDSVDEQGSTGSLMLVGDAKQAIYRWRGGKAEQFLSLANQDGDSFLTAPKVHILPKNYRSHEEIVTFNNAFFTSISSHLNNGSYRELFLNGNRQECNGQEGGLVSLQFINENDTQNKDELYSQAVSEAIREVSQKGYSLRDICILTRKRADGVLLATHLMQEGVPIVSSETLLLSNNPKVKFLINLLHYSCKPNYLEIAYEILLFLAPANDLKHTFISSHLKTIPVFFKECYDFDVDFFTQSTVYDGLEYAIKKFGLVAESDAYITFLLDEVLDVAKREGNNAQLFLEYWDKKHEKLSIVAPESVDAVKIMTIHKSKGLEFPIVIFPYAETPIYREKDPKIWLPLENVGIHGFSEFLVNKKKELSHYGEEAEYLYHEEQHKLELDAYNVLYVALTRAVKGLYIISKNDDAKGAPNIDNYSGLFIHFLMERKLWESTKMNYTFGYLETSSSVSSLEKSPDQRVINFQLSQKEAPSFKMLTTAGALWGTEREDALTKGNLMHKVLGFLESHRDMEKTLDTLKRQGEINEVMAAEVQRSVQHVISHPDLKTYFKEGNTVFMERDILTKDGSVLRPDRLIFQDKNVTIVDYKTGKKSANHHKQLKAYEDALQQMGYGIANKILVYMNEEVTTEFI